MTKPRADSLYRKGPSDVIPWLRVTRDSPVELDRKFSYIIGHHKALAKAEGELNAAKKKGQFKSVVRDLTARVQNTQAWLDFSVETLTNHVRHALARCEPATDDGKLLREHGKQRKRYGKLKPLRFRKPREDAARQIRHYATVLEEFIMAKAACAGHSGSDKALRGLIEHASGLIAKFRNHQFREQDDAEQLAMMSLLKAAAAFSASHKRMARFNTFAWWKAKRATETRTTRDCKPGIAIIQQDGEKKMVSVASINAAPAGKDDARDAYHPPTAEIDQGRRLDIQRALAELSEIEKAAVIGVLMENKSLRHVTRETGFSSRRLRDALDRGQVKLRRLLADFE